MNYDLRDKEQRGKFVKRCNSLLKNQRKNVCVVDESSRTLNQNSYLHILCRIMAAETGVTEEYAKNVYFKQLANPEIFSHCGKDPVTNEMVVYLRSVSDLSIGEMRTAITRFRDWAAENGYYLPDANVGDDGSVSFTSEESKEAFHKAEIATSHLEGLI